MNPELDPFFTKDGKWRKEFNALRKIVLECELEETRKWMHPCYTYNGNNVILIHGFKEYCALLFHKGVLLKDPEGILIQQTQNVQSARQLRFTDLEDIINLAPVIKSYIFEAIEVEKAGLTVEMKKTREYDVPEELERAFEADPEFQTAFEALPPGRQRGYLLYFGQARQSGTRESRIEKSKAAIFAGKGYNDR